MVVRGPEEAAPEIRYDEIRLARELGIRISVHTGAYGRNARVAAVQQYAGGLISRPPPQAAPEVLFIDRLGRSFYGSFDEVRLPLGRKDYYRCSGEVVPDIGGLLPVKSTLRASGLHMGR